MQRGELPTADDYEALIPVFAVLTDRRFVTSENSAQFEEHALMPSRSDCPAELNRSKDRIDQEGADDIAWSL